MRMSNEEFNQDRSGFWTHISVVDIYFHLIPVCFSGLVFRCVTQVLFYQELRSPSCKFWWEKGLWCGSFTPFIYTWFTGWCVLNTCASYLQKSSSLILIISPLEASTIPLTVPCKMANHCGKSLSSPLVLSVSWQVQFFSFQQIDKVYSPLTNFNLVMVL